MLRSTLGIRREPFQSLRPEALSLANWVELYQSEDTGVRKEVATSL